MPRSCCAGTWAEVAASLSGTIDCIQNAFALTVALLWKDVIVQGLQQDSTSTVLSAAVHGSLLFACVTILAVFLKKRALEA